MPSSLLETLYSVYHTFTAGSSLTYSYEEKVKSTCKPATGSDEQKHVRLIPNRNFLSTECSWRALKLLN